MDKQRILREAQKIAAKFSFWMVSENIAHLYGYVYETPEKKYVLPRGDICFLPLPATTSELLAKYIHGKLKELYPNNKIVVKVGESKSSLASYEE